MNILLDSTTDSTTERKAERENVSHQVCGSRPLVGVKYFLEQPFGFLKGTKTNFGGGFLLAMISNYVFVRGILYHLVVSASLPVSRDLLQLPAEVYSVTAAIVSIPWCIKSMVGACSDIWAISGYHKRPYILVFAVVGFLGSIILVINIEHLTFNLLVIGFFMIMVQTAFNDLLCEGAYSRKMTLQPETGAAMITFVWLCMSVGSLCQAIWIGPAVDYLGLKASLLPLLPLSLQQVLCMAFPWPVRSWKKYPGLLDEHYTPPKARFKKKLLRRNWKLIMTATTVVFLAFGSIVVGLCGDKRQKAALVYVLVSGLALVCVMCYSIPTALLKPILFIFLRAVMVPSVSSQMTYWMRAGPDCVEDGPQFSWTFLLTWTSIMHAIFAFVGVALFQRFVSKWTFRRAFLVTSILQQLTSLFDLAFVLRWNRVLNISDYTWYFCSAAIIEEIIGMWARMPASVLMSRLCPKSMESTMFSIVSAVHSFGGILSKYLGNFLCVYFLDIRTLPTDPGGCNFTNLPWAVGLSWGVFPIIPLILTYFLVPDSYMNVHLAHDAEEEQADDNKSASNGASTERGISSPGDDGNHEKSIELPNSAAFSSVD